MAAPATTYIPAEFPMAAYTVNDGDDAGSKTVTVQVYRGDARQTTVITLTVPNGKLVASRTALQDFLARCRTDVQGGQSPLVAVVGELPQLRTDLAALGVTI